jgi:hypothetical protein
MISLAVFWIRVVWCFVVSWVVDKISQILQYFQPGVEKLEHVSILRNGPDWMYLPRNLPPRAFESVSLVFEDGNEVDVTQPAHIPYPFPPFRFGASCYRVIGLDGEAEDHNDALV